MSNFLKALFSSFTPLEKKVFWSAVVFLFLSALALSLNWLYAVTKISPISGGEYTEGIVGQPTIINPVLISQNDVDRDLSELIFAGLLDLSEDYKVSENGRVFNVVLKKDARWSDGEPLTSDDIIYTLELIQDANTHSPLLPAWQGVVGERLSEREIRFTLKTPYAFFADNLKDFKIIPRHIFSSIPSSNIRLSNYNLEPVGSGPYVFSRYEKQKNGFVADYFLKINENFTGTKPYLESIHLKFFTTAQEVIASFNRLELNGFGGLDYSALDNLRVGYATHELNIPRYYAVFFNPGVSAALKDKNVRLALNLSANNDEIIKSIFAGHAAVSHGPLRSAEGKSTSTPNAKFSPEEAQKLLDNAGWNLGHDGIREKTFGKQNLKLEFEMVVPQIKFLVGTANILKDNWAKIGVKLIVIPTNPADISANIIKTRNYQMLMFGNVLKNNSDIFAFWHSSERFYPGLNLSLYENKKVDSLLESIRKDFDSNSRAKNLNLAESLIVADSPAIFLYSPKYIYVLGGSIHGFDAKEISTPSNRFSGISNWYAKTKRVFIKS